MKYTGTNHLNSIILAQLDILPETEYIPFYTENIDRDYSSFHFLTENNRLISFIGIMPVSADTIELTAYTIPSFRRQGHFTFLLKAVMKELSSFPSLRIVSEKELLFPFIKNTFSHKEYLMRLSSDTFPGIAQTAVVTVMEYTYKTPEESEYVYVLKKQNTALGIMKITHETDSKTACLHHIKIRRPFRGRGYGFLLLTQALTLFWNKITQKNCDIVLHVTSTNTAALHLYQKLGFQIIQSLDYYRLEEQIRQ